MKKLILLFLITLTSCASRQTKIDKLVVKKDSVTETKAILTVTETKEKTDSTNIITMVDSSEVIITPIDTCKEIVVDGKVYKNVVLRIKKNKVNTSYTNNKRESNIKRTDSIGTTKTSVTEDTVEKIKTIDKKTNYWTLFYWIILFIIIYLLYKNRKRVFDLL
jgi:hypothetical protein